MTLLLAAACGSSSSFQPLPSPTATPAPTFAGPTPTAGSVAAMRLGAIGTVTSVNTREWIAVYRSTPLPIGQGQIILPPDAGPDAGPVPVVGCPWMPPIDPACEQRGQPLAVGESDWVVAYATDRTPSGFLAPFQYAAGPAGEVEWLIGFGLPQFSDEVRPAPPARFIGSLDASESPRIPVLWREPGASWERLPAEGFVVGPRPYQGDATGRIVGAGLEPELPVLWSESAGAFRLEILPSLEGGGRGGAYGIDGDVIAGWSDDGGGARQAVVWIERDGAFVPQKLPRPADALRCDHAIAVSGSFVAGECVYAAGRGVAVVWQRTDDATWTVRAILQPLDGDEDSAVVGLAGTLAAGSSSLDRRATPVAWRIAATEGAAGD
jgi:hypothetical protein